MEKRQLGRTNIPVSKLVFGGNVFGWTANRETSFALLDRMHAMGLDTLDTADVYSVWAPGNQGGESETIIGDWMQSRGNRDKVIIITKVGYTVSPDKKGLAPAYIEKAVEDSLRRLKTDYIDVYLSHIYDDKVPCEETLAAHEKLIRAGKVRAIGASNHDASQLKEALDVAQAKHLPRYDVLQPEYNLYDRFSLEGPLLDLCKEQDIGVITYFSLAKGFLSGKYRSKADLGQSPRGAAVGNYLTERGLRILAVLDTLSEKHQAKPAEIALAWVMAQPGITAPIASATTLEQLDSLIKSTSISLDMDDLDLLDATRT